MQCPKCGHPVDQDFGVFPCAKCHTVLFVDMEGQVQLSNPEEEGAVAQSAVIAEAISEVVEAEPISTAQTSVEAPPVITPIAEPPQLVQSLREEMTAFANTEGVPGKISYIIKIEQIDTSDLRNRVHDALADRRFRWDAKVLINRISKGSLLLLDISAAKAIVLISRLQELPVKVSWQQKIL